MAVTNGGEIGNYWVDATGFVPASGIINTESFTIVDGSFAMRKGCNLTFNSENFFLQDYVEFLNNTRVDVKSGAVVLGADMVGVDDHAEDYLVLEGDLVELYDTNFTWQHITVEIRSMVVFYLPSSMPANSAFVFAPTGSIDLTDATVCILFISLF